MLGDAVYKHFSKVGEVRASDLCPRADWLRHVDVGDFQQFRNDVEDFQPTLLVNLAAQTDLEFCEENSTKAWRDNALGAENGALIANSNDIPYVFISTAGIFAGEKEYYVDYDEPKPLTVYGRSKFYGERFTERTARKFFVLRAGWMMGGGQDLDKKFINKLYKQIASGATELYAVTDKLGTPTYTKDFSRGMEIVVRSGLYGTYNQVCGGRASRYEVAVEFVRLLGMDTDIKVHPVGSDHFAREYYAVRPASEQLINLKLDQRGLNVMRDWQVCLAEYVAECFAPSQ